MGLRLSRILAVFTPVLVAVATAGLLGCVTIPGEHRTLHGNARGVVDVAATPCTAAGARAEKVSTASTALDGEHLRVLTWNVHRTGDAGWREDFERLAAGHDVVALQEAYLTDVLYSALMQQRYHWRLNAAFQLFNVDAGVLTAARVPAERACSLRHIEPLTRIPKSALTTTYRLAGVREPLLMANLHGLNFTLGTTAFREQLEAVAELLASHGGPIILAGDFNTWSAARREVLESVTASLGLTAVPLADDHRTRFLGEAVDGMYYRGLEVIEAVAYPVTSSDHNPVSVTFRAARPARAQVL
jgi:endonuclease/exonuclease/phosphatase (EEP) superfamily protein YafD